MITKKIWKNFVITWDPERTISAKIISLKHLVLSKAVYVNILKILESKFWKKILKTCNKKLKVKKFFNITIAYKSIEN